jgi:hypothetical protein
MNVIVEDILHHIAQQMSCWNGAGDTAAPGRFFDLHVSITTDVEDTELTYLKKYGEGHTFYFRLRDYKHGRSLASDLYYRIKGIRPDMSAYTGDSFTPDERLYLFVHVRDISPTTPNPEHPQRLSQGIA